VLRVAAAIASIVPALAALAPAPSALAVAGSLAAPLAGVLLLLGLWTPVAAAVCAILAVIGAVAAPDRAGIEGLLAAIGCALLLLGPGAWSVDARLFGWRRIEIGRLRRPEPPSE